MACRRMSSAVTVPGLPNFRLYGSTCRSKGSSPCLAERIRIRSGGGDGMGVPQAGDEIRAGVKPVSPAPHRLLS